MAMSFLEPLCLCNFFLNVTATSEIYTYCHTLSLHDALPISQRPLARRVPVTIASRDGLTLPSYLTLPTNTKLGDNGMPAAPVPMVLLVHGGPRLRDDLAFDPQHAWLADRGSAVLSVNLRASGGFGSDFMAKGDRKWSETEHDDTTEASACGKGWVHT